MIGRTIAHYRIIEKLGAGGMGVVYKADDTALQRTVALKFLPPELTRDPEAKQRFLHEARAAARLDHPNICAVFEIGETADDSLYIVMACYEGETLRERIQRGPLPWPEAGRLAVQAAASLDHAHT
ncbi:MAG: serine/threonine protein kinase [Acidobacteria bacterium]|nr:serine/threonine protein kinase [Acidobacteriota bacterium]